MEPELYFLGGFALAVLLFALLRWLLPSAIGPISSSVKFFDSGGTNAAELTSPLEFRLGLGERVVSASLHAGGVDLETPSKIKDLPDVGFVAKLENMKTGNRTADFPALDLPDRGSKPDYLIVLHVAFDGLLCTGSDTRYYLRSDVVNSDDSISLGRQEFVRIGV